LSPCVGFDPKLPAREGRVRHFALGFFVAEELAAGRGRPGGFAFGPGELGRQLPDFAARLIGDALLEESADGLDARVDRRPVLTPDRDGERQDQAVGLDLDPYVGPGGLG